MKKIFLLTFTSLIFILGSCTKSLNENKTTTYNIYDFYTTDNTMNKDNTNIEYTYKELFSDSYYKDGFKVYYTDEGNQTTYPYKLVTLNEDTNPSWELCQWSSKYDIMNSKKTSGFGEFSFVNNETNPESKKVLVNTNTGVIRLVLNAESEYDSDRLSGESWPHLLLQQNFDNNLVNISSQKEMNMIINFKVNKCENKTISNYDEGLHCAQLVWYITLQNRNKASKDYGKYIWFGLNLFDSRYTGTITSEYGSVDSGKENNTGCFIYQPSSSIFMENKKMTTVGVDTSIKLNILPLAKYAYTIAIERGYLGSTKFEELYIGSTNFGFEVPGTFNIDATISKVQIEYR